MTKPLGLPQLKKYLGPALSALRENAGLTQAKLAEKIGKTNTDVSKYERGDVIPRADVLADYVDSCGGDFAGLQEALELTARLAAIGRKAKAKTINESASESARQEATRQQAATKRKAEARKKSSRKKTLK